MRRWYPLTQLFMARLREFYREPEVLFWVYGFPLLLAVGLGLAFSSKKPEPPDVDVQSTPDLTLADLLCQRLKDNGITAELHAEDECERRLNTGRSALCVVPSQVDGKDVFRYVYDEARPESVSARYQVEAVIGRWEAERQKSGSSWENKDELRSEPGTRYIDFLLPGLIGLNLMGGGLWGVGFVLVDMRVRKLLKRLLATPMRRSDFLLSILSARMALLLPEMALLVLVGLYGFHVPLRGGVLSLVLCILIGAAAFSGIGLLVACRTDKTETASGLMNLVMLPMWLMSGTFFRSTRFPEVMQPFIQALPLTQLNDALREVMLDGYSVAHVAWRLAILAAWAVVTFALALRWFRWT
jgi:ABC-type multidrug transport system permease subunit